jgi:uncharacterized protein
MKLFLLFLIIIMAQAVETVTGFGATAISLGLGSYIFSLKEMVIALVAIGWLQALFLVIRGFKHILWKILLTRIVVFCALGMPVGMWFYKHFGEGQLRFFLGLFVVLIAIQQIYLLIKGDGDLKPLHLAFASVVLIAAGFIYGIFAAGGPLVVYYASREIKDKAAFRATISMLWLILNSALLIRYAVGGMIERQTVELAGLLIPALVIGILIGEVLHKRVNERIFKFVVQGILLLTGISLLLYK